MSRKMMLMVAFILSLSLGTPLLLIAKQDRSFRHFCKSNENWIAVNHDICNSRSNPFVQTPNVKNVSKLEILWSTALPTPSAGIEGAPIVKDGVIFYADLGGTVFARNLDNGNIIWQRNFPNASFNGPVLVRKQVVYCVPTDLNLYALDINTGNILWSVPVDPTALVGDATMYGGINTADGLLFVPLSGTGFGEAGTPAPTFHGSLSAFDANTGALAWRFYPNPIDPNNPTLGSGVGIWSSPAIDTKNKLLFCGTGNAYFPPAGPNSDALLAINYKTGKLVWKHQFLANDVFGFNFPLGPNRDVGCSPNLFEAKINGRNRHIVGVNSKFGIYTAFNRKTGKILWETPISPYSYETTILGNPSAAVANGVVYAIIAVDPFSLLNSETTIKIVAGDPQAFALAFTAAATSLISVITAMDTKTGKPLWRYSSTGSTLGSITEANGIIYAGRASGLVEALNAKSGDLLFNFQFPPFFNVPSFIGAPITVVDNRVIVTTGFFDPRLPGGITVFSIK
jgi:outer membrane protein assembly factor BamB